MLAEGYARLSNRAKVDALTAHLQDDDLESVAQAYLEVGDVDNAVEVFHRHSVAEPTVVKELLKGSIGLTDRGRGDDAVRALMQARSFAAKIQEPVDRSLLRTLIAVRLNRAGKRADARALLAEVFGNRADTNLSFIPIELASDIAAIDAARASSVLESFLRSNVTADTLSQHAVIQLAKAGPLEETKRFLNEARTAARAIRDPSAASQRLSVVSTGFAEIHAFREARLTADECDNVDHKLFAYSWIVSSHARFADARLQQAWERVFDDYLWNSLH